MNQVVSKFDVMMAQMREDAQQCNLRCGLNRYPKLPDTGIKPVGYAGPRPPKAYVVERREKVDRMVSQGLTSPEIARALGVSIDTVKSDCHFLRQEGRLPEIKPGYRLSAAQKIRRREVAKHLAEGRSLKEIAALVGAKRLRSVARRVGDAQAGDALMDFAPSRMRETPEDRAVLDLYLAQLGMR